MKLAHCIGVRARAAVACVLSASVAFACARATSAAPSPPPHAAQTTYAMLSNDAVATTFHRFYVAPGLWRDCPEPRCAVHNGDWGSDALTYTLYLRWSTTGDARMLPLLEALARSARRYARPCSGRRCRLWSDVPMWDAVASSREAEALAKSVLPSQKATAAFWAVEASPVYSLGACPSIRYQRPFGRGDRLKTLETDSNGIKAALLLYTATHERRYLRIARSRYHAVRRWFLDGRVPLYTTYVFDDGKHCRQVPQRYFASVNGNMIWNGLRLARATGERAYRVQALATALAVVRHLSDANGIFADLQAENDLSGPLVEAMLALATSEHRAFARRWLLENASAAFAARRADGTYGRFFDGPPPRADVTAWQTSGSFALEIAAASLAPNQAVRAPAWRRTEFFARGISTLPATIRLRGDGIAVIGTIGDICCQFGHARVFVDGVETTNHIGIWQNKSSSGQSFPGSVLFAWRWRTSGAHVVTFLAGRTDAKEGGAFFHARGYIVSHDAPLRRPLDRTAFTNRQASRARRAGEPNRNETIANVRRPPRFAAIPAASPTVATTAAPSPVIANDIDACFESQPRSNLTSPQVQQAVLNRRRPFGERDAVAWFGGGLVAC